MFGSVPLKTDQDLLDRLAHAREPSPQERREQRVSFVFASIDPESRVTREEVRRKLESA